MCLPQQLALLRAAIFVDSIQDAVQQLRIDQALLLRRLPVLHLFRLSKRAQPIKLLADQGNLGLCVHGSTSERLPFQMRGAGQEPKRRWRSVPLDLGVRRYCLFSETSRLVFSTSAAHFSQTSARIRPRFTPYGPT